MTNPKVTVLIPTHNRADVLSYSIQSVLWQTERDFELLVVGDGCTDDTAAVIARFDDERIRWFDLPKGRFKGYANRNLALREARGKYIAYGQDDDLFLPDHIERLVASLDTVGAEWGYCRALWCTGSGVIVPVGTNLTNADELHIFLTQGNTIPSSSVMHTREILERSGYWPEELDSLGDLHLWRRMVQHSGGTIAYSRVPTILHFRAEGQDALPAVATMAEIAEVERWWPSECKVAIPPRTHEQRLIFDAIKADRLYGGKLQAAADRIVDRIAWGAVFAPARPSRAEPIDRQRHADEKQPGSKPKRWLASFRRKRRR